ncbi:MAG: LptF/LptG family permease [candidate division KSB1 bacterium]|nr:LptF/LptG family permease [candidate division KSB1 bacterium]MDZ7275846.1 LptF/LptG family permease [candidate division KSB1 bacterium]MDZ7287596.1 LptF/LptG family permease [candidate division KSB1 bacterium]MDZ7306500.1 LptF/LptG family permease [candidate division KSB1 bacterium]MDZ7350574.1 LptF/LptG family permease [candidate division KSB1 bacterium]
MPRFILARYILREHIGPFFFAFSLITLLFLLNLLFRELSRILSKGLPWHVVLEFFLLNLAWIVALAVPMAVLTATLMAFGRLAADNEITAMEASGISIYRIIAPAFLAAGALAVFMVWFNNNVLPDFNHRTRLLGSDIARKRPGISIEPGVWYDGIPNYGLLVQDLEDSSGVTRARNLLINDYSSTDLNRTISARRGLLELSASQGALVLTLFDGEMQEIDLKKSEEFRRIAFPKHIIKIPVDDMFLSRSESAYRGDREKSAAHMRAEVRQNHQEIAGCREQINTILAGGLPASLRQLLNIPADSSAGNARWDNFAGVPDSGPHRSRVPTTAGPSLQGGLPPAGSSHKASLVEVLNHQRHLQTQINRQLMAIQQNQRRIKALSVEIQKKYSIPVACLVFVMIGAPLGTMARRGGMATAGGLSLLFFLIYWTFLVGGEDLAKRQIISPFMAMWSANLFVGACGLFLLIRSGTVRPSTDLSWVIKLLPRRPPTAGPNSAT